jgi:hypothetical protein
VKPGTPEQEYLDDMKRLIDALRRERSAVQTGQPLTEELPRLLALVAQQRYELVHQNGRAARGKE